MVNSSSTPSAIRTQYKYENTKYKIRKIRKIRKFEKIDTFTHFTHFNHFRIYFSHKGNIVEIQIFYSLYLITIRGQYKDLECMQRYYK